MKKSPSAIWQRDSLCPLKGFRLSCSLRSSSSPTRSSRPACFQPGLSLCSIRMTNTVLWTPRLRLSGRGSYASCGAAYPSIALASASSRYSTSFNGSGGLGDPGEVAIARRFVGPLAVILRVPLVLEEGQRPVMVYNCVPGHICLLVLLSPAHLFFGAAFDLANGLHAQGVGQAGLAEASPELHPVHLQA